MINPANITITNPQGVYYGVYDNDGTWTQADLSNNPTHFAVLRSLPSMTGIYEGVVYEDGETAESVLYSAETEVCFNPLFEETYIGSITISGETVSGGSLSGIGYLSSVESDDYGTDLYLNENEDGTFSILVENYRLKKENSFRTLILTLLFTDGRADQFLVANAKNRRGWVEDDSFVSLMWLLDQSRLNQDVVNKTISFAKSALQYMIENKICTDLKITGEIISRRGIQLAIEFRIGNNIIKEYVNLWRKLS